MKKQTTLWIVICAYAICIIGGYFITKMIIDKKDLRLRRAAYNSLEDFFSSQNRFINIGYSGKTVSYEQILIPPKPQLVRNPKTFLDSLEYSMNDSYGRRLAEWNDEYGDLRKLYKLKPKYVSEQSWNSDNQWSGWLFYGFETANKMNITEFQIYPYEVGQKKQSDEWGYYFMPSIQEAVDDAFEFHTTNSKSSYINDIVRNGEIAISTLRNKVDNDYYELWSYDNMCKWQGKEYVDSIIRWTDWSKYPVPHHLLPCEYSYVDGLLVRDYYCGGMYNGYYSVRNKYVTLGYWDIKYNWYWNPKAEDLKKMRIWYFGVLSTLFMACLIILLIIISKEKKINNESLKVKLLRQCNPQKLLENKPYNKELTDLANNLFQEINSTDESSETDLKELRQQAISTFGISFIEKKRLEELKRRCNPERYMKPYNAEKVSLANKLYDRLCSNDITIDEIEEIELQSKSLN